MRPNYLILLCLILIFAGACSKNDVVPPQTTIDPVEKAQGPCGSIALAATASSPAQTLNYCWTDPAHQFGGSVDTARVFYYWHGIFGSEKEILDGGNGATEIRQLFAALGKRMPAIVSLSVGSTTPVADEAERIVQSAIPELEARLASRKTVERILFGISMGGHNALRVAAAKPDLFKGIVALCPALANFDVTDTAQLNAYLQRHQAVLDQTLATAVISAMKTRFPTSADWLRNTPFTFLTSGNYDHAKIFLSVGGQDSLGFNEGTESFANQLTARGGVVDLKLTNGGHCAFDRAGLLRFLRQL